MKTRYWRWTITLALVALVGIAWLGASARTASAPTYNSYDSGRFFFPPYPSDNDRMGLSSAIDMYNPALRPGWYMNWDASLNPPHPDGAEHARTIRLNIHDTGSICGGRAAPAWQRSQVSESITGTDLIENLHANPGALWLIGNEPDSIYNGDPIMPELYAELYYEFYTFIKTHDPSARVAVAAIVQPSPLRLEYLDKVLNRYQALYGEKLPTALWNIHMYTLREVSCDYGGGTPPGATQNGWLYDWWQWSDINLLKLHLPEMRQWMAARGERDKPLIITEFGVLVPDDGTYCGPGGCITQETSRDYLQQTFSYFLTATDPNIGFPADNNHIIQAWAWYSLYDYRYGGDLVYPNPPTYTLTLAGQAFAQLSSQYRTAYADLYPVPLITPSLPSSGAEPVTVSLTVQLDNRGNRAVQSVPVHFAQYDYASGQLLNSTLVTVSQVLTRYAGIQPIVNHQWILAPNVAYTLTVEIDPSHTISQARRSPQRLTFVLGRPNLAITRLTADYPVVGYWDRPVTWTLTATIRNFGIEDAPTSLLKLNGLGVGGIVYPGQDVPVPALAQNASTQVTGTAVFSSPGNYTISATLQYTSANELTYANTVTLLVGEPDIFAMSLSGSPSVFSWNQPTTVTVMATVGNVGHTSSPSGTAQLDLFNETTGISYAGVDIALPSLTPNTLVTITGALTIPAPGAYTLTSTIQLDGLDWNSQNNSITTRILAAAHQFYLPIVFRASP